MALRWSKCVCNLAGSLRTNNSLFHLRSGLGKLPSSNCRNVGMKAVSRKWNLFTWYNQMLDKYPIRTKCITSGVLFGMGDYIAQKSVYGQNSGIDDKRLLRAIIYGICSAPLAHFHFNFLEWLLVKKIVVRASIVPFVKMFFDQFVYWAPGMTAVYHVSMGVMEGLSYNDIVDRLKALYWPTLKACWMLWPAVMVVTFKFIPVAHQLNFCLAVCLVWATVLSVIRAPATNNTEEIKHVENISIANFSVDTTREGK